MNKTGFINELSKVLSYSIEKCTIINNILEDNFFLSKKNKDNIIKELAEKLDVNETKAESIYETAMTIINNEMKYRLKHPFKNKE